MLFCSAVALLYRILENHRLHILPLSAVLITMMICAAYLWFNRVIKYIIQVKSMRGHCYETTFTIQNITRRRVGRGSYKVFIGEYTDAENRRHSKEIHSAFSIRKWNIGDEIRIRVSEADPESIVVVFSDTAMAIFMSILGAICESVLMIAVIYANKHQ